MHMMKADVMVDIHARNNHIAEHVHEHLAEHKIFAVNIMGAPGAGKTTTLENLLKHLDAYLPEFFVCYLQMGLINDKHHIPEFICHQSLQPPAALIYAAERRFSVKKNIVPGIPCINLRMDFLSVFSRKGICLYSGFGTVRALKRHSVTEGCQSVVGIGLEGLAISLGSRIETLVI